MRTSGAARVTLPGGYWAAGVCHRDATLRALTGEDEAFLCDEGAALLPAARTTALLGRCLLGLGSCPITADTARLLTVGDREALLLHLRRLTLGERVHCVVNCPASGCGEKMDVELTVADLLLSPYSHSRPQYELTVVEGEERFRVRARLPTGADAEAVAPLALAGLLDASDTLLRRCIETVTHEGGQPVNSVPPPVARAIPGMLAELDPQAELRLQMQCPACAWSFPALLDTGAFLFHEIAGGIDRLFREVHRLAFHYHWNEREILRLTPARRRRYLSLLSEAQAW